VKGESPNNKRARADAYRAVLGDDFDCIENALSSLVADVIEVAKRRGEIDFDSVGVSGQRKLVLSESDLKHLGLEVAENVIRFVAAHWGNAVEQQIVRAENMELLREEGSVAKAEKDRRRGELICELYKSVRPSFSPGRSGNGEANRTVKYRFEMQTGETITVRTVRDTVREAGLTGGRRSKGKN
jgi:hypothetical protein